MFATQWMCSVWYYWKKMNLKTDLQGQSWDSLPSLMQMIYRMSSSAAEVGWLTPMEAALFSTVETTLEKYMECCRLHTAHHWCAVCIYLHNVTLVYICTEVNKVSICWMRVFQYSGSNNLLDLLCQHPLNRYSTKMSHGHISKKYVLSLIAVGALKVTQRDT